MKQRTDKLLAAMPGGFEAALVSTDVNRFYFLGFDSGDAGTVLILPDKTYFIIDSRYIEIAEATVKEAEVILEGKALEQVRDILAAHGVPGDKRIEAGDFVTMDFGANVDGYCTDMTRTVAVGHVSDEQKKVYDTVLKAQLACCGFAKAGYKGCEVDKVARDIIYGAGYEGCFGHGLGHAVGIEIHENPRYSPTCSDIIQSGMVMTIEPGIYLPGKFGVRIEDTTFVRPDGCEIVGKSPKELIVL